MTADDWSVVSAIGTAVQAVAAVVGFYFVVGQLKLARKTADLQMLQAFVKEAREHEDRLESASGEGAKDKAFYEFLNFLEMNAAAFNDDLFSKTTKRMVKEKLRDSIVIVQELTEWHSKFESAVTTESTFIELAKFIEKYRKYINKAIVRNS